MVNEVNKTLRLEWGDITYLKLGQGPVLIFFHGGIATPRAYESFFKLLASRFTVIAPTHPGHGNSFSIDGKWTLQDYLRCYIAFFSKLQITPAVLSGHSFGGMMALLMGSYFPEVPIVVMDPCGLPIKLTGREYIQFMTNEARDLFNARPDLEVLAETAPAAGTLIHTVVRHPENLTWLSANITKFDISHQLRHLKNKVGFIWGENDAIVPLKTGLLMKKLVKYPLFKVMTNAGHIYPVTDCNLTYETFINMLRDLKSL